MMEVYATVLLNKKKKALVRKLWPIRQNQLDSRPVQIYQNKIFFLLFLSGQKNSLENSNIQDLMTTLFRLANSIFLPVNCASKILRLTSITGLKR